MTAGQVLADREHRYKAVPSWAVFRALTDHRKKWMRLGQGEVVPSLLEAVPNDRVVWSSLWPISASDTIELGVRQDGVDAILRFRWLSSAPPDERGIASRDSASTRNSVASCEMAGVETIRRGRRAACGGIRTVRHRRRPTCGNRHRDLTREQRGGGVVAY